MYKKSLITEKSVLCELNLFKPVFSPGPDGLPGCVLRYCAGSLYLLLHRLFTLSVASCSISPYQHGFVKHRSTTTNLLEFFSLVIKGFKNKMQIDVVYTDFSTAFNSVNHCLLLNKLNLIVFPYNLRE